ncbi:MAG: hypothetical protein JRF45_00400 [Deltaproteobacteria bacterium]|nr:hypothetical protein [Deltaproteobacteria bacterium]MBW1826402.1 hypothetical protein [Deltaproteobacteria bacterium]MBW1967904.1 hypothetical protein [Deltaproteobacteria bacterium]MBW2158101.1 hypothetical protein [Deltaproteobacteria bacterium]MBW2197393.1 hypothetical protein [Deltaproteobacteria bacterium]
MRSRSKTKKEKVEWSGRIVAVQARIRLMRSFDERHHSYQGFVLRMDGTCADENREFIIAIGKAAHQKHQFRIGMEVCGLSIPVPDPRMETAGFYKTSGLNILKKEENGLSSGPPFHGVPPDLETYRSRGHRRLDARTYEAKCTTCIWSCRMPVEMIIDHWNSSQKRHRFETFCYGPKSCSFYRPGPTRKVPGRKGMSYTEEDWVDEDATSHRGPDD